MTAFDRDEQDLKVNFTVLLNNISVHFTHCIGQQQEQNSVCSNFYLQIQCELNIDWSASCMFVY